MDRHGHQSTNRALSPDVIIIGAGFAGISALYHLRKLGLTCRIVERGEDIGGVWYWNRYPGARVDSGIPSYVLNIPECWESWTWTELFPDHNEMSKFVNHCDRQIGIRKDTIFAKSVTGARFDSCSARWEVELDGGDEARMSCKYLICAVGTTSHRYKRMDKMLDNFHGRVYFPSLWPQRANVDLGRQDVAVIGTGSSGLQIVQELGPRVKSLTVYQRSYHAALPLPMSPFGGFDHRTPKDSLPALFESRKTTPSGLAMVAPQSKGTFEVSDSERHQMFEELYAKGLPYWVGGFKDLTTNPEANRAAYDFWARQTRSRIQDPRKRDIIAPLEPTYPFGAKRIGLECGYFDLFNRNNVDVIDTSANSIAAITGDGIVLKDGTSHRHDVIIPAMGYDLGNEIIKSLGLRDTENTPVDQLWSTDGIRTFVGIMHHGYPNMFMICGPQSPGEQGNVPTCIDIQATWIAETVHKMEEEQIVSIRPKSQSAEEWNTKVHEVYNQDYYASTRSRYTESGNPLFYGGGIDRYYAELKNAGKTWDHFEIVKHTP
ncbi:putative steroid monooxygenase [Aspergillus indologenus CBS 114.80]|uniref:Putative steroid monooxygenase n=1 Tax=Aspergillus indologenus CBS 114.80 TaxID=1450541 RepID=A0A2V5HRW9_9EURO|nr:putative steroid monooxygenase [Aspergillus indologenus CBS 114.80]